MKGWVRMRATARRGVRASRAGPDLSRGLPLGTAAPPVLAAEEVEPARLGLGLVSRLGLVSAPPAPLGLSGPSRLPGHGPLSLGTTDSRDPG